VGSKEMARVNRHSIPGYVWHIPHRCHEQFVTMQGRSLGSGRKADRCSGRTEAMIYGNGRDLMSAVLTPQLAV